MSPLMWMAFVALAVLVAFLLMTAIDALGNTRPIRRINGWAAIDAARRDPLGGGSLSWCRQHSPRTHGLTWTRPTVTPLRSQPAGGHMTTVCRHCQRPIRPGDDVAPWVHTDTGNSFCDVEGPADAVEGRRMPPRERYEAEPEA